MLKLRTDTVYVAPNGKLVQAGYEALQGQFDGQSTVATGLETRLTAVEDTTSFIKRQAAIAATGQTELPQTGIPSWVNRVTATLSLLSTSGTSDGLLQVGDGAFVTTGYACNYQGFTGSATGLVTSTAGFLFDIDNAANQNGGKITLDRHGTSNTWVATGMIRRNGSSNGFVVGEITLTGALDRARITTVGGSDTFDAGSVSFSWE